MIDHKHQLRTPEGMEGVAECPVCGGFEGTLTTLCAGARLSETVLQAVYDGQLDFNVGGMNFTPIWWGAQPEAYQGPNNFRNLICSLEHWLRSRASRMHYQAENGLMGEYAKSLRRLLCYPAVVPIPERDVSIDDLFAKKEAAA